MVCHQSPMSSKVTLQLYCAVVMGTWRQNTYSMKDQTLTHSLLVTKYIHVLVMLHDSIRHQLSSHFSHCSLAYISKKKKKKGRVSAIQLWPFHKWLAAWPIAQAVAYIIQELQPISLGLCTNKVIQTRRTWQLILTAEFNTFVAWSPFAYPAQSF